MNQFQQLTYLLKGSVSHKVCRTGTTIFFISLVLLLAGCEREPNLYLHQGGKETTMDLPKIDLELKVLWDYEFKYDVVYDWEAEWKYGWDDEDNKLFGKIGYTEPSVFEIRRYFTQDVQYGAHEAPYKNLIQSKQLTANYDFGFWDILAWNDIQTADGIQSVRIDESSTYEYVTANTGQTMFPSKYNASQFSNSFYQPEELFAGYEKGIEINRNLDGFVFDENRNCWVRKLEMQIQPVTYIYLTQIILHNNRQHTRIVTGIDGSGNLSGMARSVNLNTGVTGRDAITVNYNMRMKFDQQMKDGEKVDIIGGRVLTFGMPKLNPSRLDNHSYMESLAKVRDADLNNIKDEVRDIIEKYRKEGKLQAADTGVEPSSSESTQNTTDLESSSNTTSVNEKYDPEKTMLQVKENHVTASLPGKSGTLTIEADITGNTDDVSKGVLKKCNISEKDICSWFGGKDGWEKSVTDETVWENKEKGLQLFISDGMIECDGLSEKDLGFLGENTEDEKLNIINQLFSKADLSGTSVRKPISDMTEGYDYYDTEVLLNGIPAGGLSQYHYQGSTGFGLKPEDCYFKIPIPLQVKEKETVTMLPMEEIMKSVEQYVKEGKIGFFTEEDTTEKTEPITIPVTKIRLKYYIDETADGIVYRPVWSFCCPYQWKDSPEEQELFYIDGETGALIRDAFGW